MSSISMVTQQTYVCNITYHPLQAPTSVVNIASYTFTPSMPPTGLNQGDHIHFTFNPASKEQTTGILDQAVLVAGYKDSHTSTESSPFHNDANNIDIHSFPTLSVGKRPGTWGFTVVFSLLFPATGTSKANTHFYFLPDPEIIIKPN